jgi:SAM-dependent methyltransferase
MSEPTDVASRDWWQAVWQDLEWGSYDQDFALWRELAAGRGDVLDLGCGAGRVALDLAEAGHSVTAVDSDEALVSDLGRHVRDKELSVEPVVADARSLDLGRQFGIVIAPMQLLQLLHAETDRAEALQRVHDHLQPGGLFATALTDLEGEGLDADWIAPLPDIREYDGHVFCSQATAIRTLDSGRAITLHRERTVVMPDGQVDESKDEVRLELITPEQLDLEMEAAGLQPLERRPIPPTDHFMGSIALIAERPA